MALESQQVAPARVKSNHGDWAKSTPSSLPCDIRGDTEILITDLKSGYGGMIRSSNERLTVLVFTEFALSIYFIS